MKQVGAVLPLMAIDVNVICCLGSASSRLLPIAIIDIIIQHTGECDSLLLIMIHDNLICVMETPLG